MRQKERIGVREGPHREGARAGWDSRPHATWRTLAVLVAGFAVLAASLYAAFEYRETRAHRPWRGEFVVVSPHR